MNRLFFTPLAGAGLDDIWLFIARDSPVQADKVPTAIHRTRNMLADEPRVGRMREDIAGQTRSFNVCSYLISYRPKDDGVMIDRVLHGSRDLPPLFH